MLSKENIDVYLDKLAEKILEKFGPEASIEIIVVGGAAIAINYTFRESTMDIDTFSKSSAYLDELVADVAKECALPTDWMNHNVMVTGSFTPQIAKYAQEYKKFRNVLDVFTADALTLVCMKSVCCRPDSHDILDIKNILDAEPEITFKQIVDRFLEFYSGWDKMSMDAQMYLTKRFNAMPPDMVDMIWEMLPNAIKNSGEDKYDICSKFYNENCVR